MTQPQWEAITWVAIGLGALASTLLLLYLLQSIGRFLRLQWSRWEEFIQQRHLQAARARRAAGGERQQQELERIEHRIRRVNLEQQALAESLQDKLAKAGRRAETMYRDLNDLHASHKKLRNENHNLRGQLHVLGHGLDHLLKRIAEELGLALDEAVIPPLPPRVELPCLITVDDDKGQQRLAAELEQYVGQANSLAGEKVSLQHRLRLQEEENATLRGDVQRLLQMNDARVQELNQNAEHLSLIRCEQERVQQEIHQKEEELRQVRMGGQMAQAAVEDMQRRIDDLYNKNRILSDTIAHGEADGRQCQSAAATTRSPASTPAERGAAPASAVDIPTEGEDPPAPAAETPVASAPAAETPVASAPAAETPVASAPAAERRPTQTAADAWLDDDAMPEEDLTPAESSPVAEWAALPNDEPPVPTDASKPQDGGAWPTHSSLRPPPI